MIELTMLSLAYEARKNELQRKHEEKMREMERWEDERLLPLMTAEFEFADDGPKANGFKFCPYCGKKLVEHKVKP